MGPSFKEPILNAEESVCLGYANASKPTLLFLNMRRLCLSTVMGMGLLGVYGAGVSATTIELHPHALGSPQEVRCPEKVIAYQTAKPYQEGSFTWDGMVNLGAIATQISVAKVDPFSVIWVGTLKPPFQSCQAAAGMFKVDGQPFSGHSYLRMQFLNGKAYFILDMTGLQDANDLTTAILRHEIVRGNPRWQWGGTD